MASNNKFLPMGEECELILSEGQSVAPHGLAGTELVRGKAEGRLKGGSSGRDLKGLWLLFGKPVAIQLEF